MGFKKGEDQNRNSNGRPKGSGNRTTEEAKQVLLQIINNNLDSLQKDMNKLRKEDLEAYLKLQVKLLDHLIPKINKLELSGEINNKIESIKIEIIKPDANRNKDN